MTRHTYLAAVAALGLMGAAANDGQKTIYWADAVPAGWNGNWPAALQTVSGRTGFTRSSARPAAR